MSFSSSLKLLYDRACMECLYCTVQDTKLFWLLFEHNEILAAYGNDYRSEIYSKCQLPKPRLLVLWASLLKDNTDVFSYVYLKLSFMMHHFHRFNNMKYWAMIYEL